MSILVKKYLEAVICDFENILEHLIYAAKIDLSEFRSRRIQFEYKISF